MIGRTPFRELHTSALVLALAALAACESPPLDPAASEPGLPLAAEALASARSDGHPMVIVRQGRGADRSTAAGAPVVENLADALDRVASGGRILVRPGTYVTQDVQIDKPVTVVGSGTPTIDAAGASTALRIFGIAEGEGTVTVKGLRFTEARSAAVSVESPHDGVLIEETEFHPTSDEFGSSGVRGLGSEGRIVVRNSAFVGGSMGVAFDEGVTDALLLDNDFVGQEIESIRFGGGSGIVSARAVDNRISGCGGPTTEACILSFGGAVTLEGNEISVDRAMDTPPVFVIGGKVQIERNTIVGNSDADLGDPSSFVIRGSAISIDNTDAAVISGNTIRHAFTGISVGTLGSGSGLDNEIDHVVVGLHINPGTIDIRSSDITNYVFALSTGDPDADLTCNWWGSAAGPVNAHAPDPSVYTPWATEPVAGTSTTTCSGGT